ncbi:nucleotide-binding alpha-beta plait domain-containing protein [Tanacetum coccineum]
MGNYRTKEDDVAKISTSVYVTNFPEYTSAKELAQACKQYGHVIDTFIPNKKSKVGKRFGCVHFINVFSEERLINNLCTVWIYRFRIHANIARFQRPKGKNEEKKSFPGPSFTTKVLGKSGDDRSFKGVLNGDKSALTEVKNNEPLIVLGDECLRNKNIYNALFGRVNEFASLANLKKALGNEGFLDITIKYMGELWVMLEFKSAELVTKFKECTSAMSWFSQVIKASKDFEVEGRVVWVEVEGIPFKLWTDNTFTRIANKWGKLLDVDNEEETCFHSKRLCIQIKSSKRINEEFKIIHCGKSYWIRAIETPEVVKSFMEGKDSDNKKENSEDPFNIYSILNRPKLEDKNTKESDGSLEYPPGFVPVGVNDESRLDNKDDANAAIDEASSEIQKDENEAHSECRENKKQKDDDNEYSSSGHFKISKAPS